MVKKYKEKNGEIMLYHIKDLDINEVFEKFHEVNFKQILSDPVQHDAMSVFFYNEDVKRNDAKGSPIEKYEDLLIGRIKFIIHILAKRCSSNKYGWTRLSTYVLKTTIENDYKKIFRDKKQITYNNILFSTRIYSSILEESH